MAWRDRDWAKWTDEERNRFLGSSTTGASYPALPSSSYSRRTRGGLIRPGAGAAILVSAALFALGHFPTSHPLVPVLHFRFPGMSATPPAVPTQTINGPTTATLGSTLNLHGTAPQGDGPVTIQGSYDGGLTWHTLSQVEAVNGSYAAQVPLNERGNLQLRIFFANGSEAVGSISVS